MQKARRDPGRRGRKRRGEFALFLQSRDEGAPWGRSSFGKRSSGRGAKDVASQGETKGVFRFSCFVAMVPLLTGAFGSASVLSTRARPAPPYVGSRRRKPVQSRHSPATVRRTTCGRSPRGNPWKARTEEDSKSGYCADDPTAPSSRAEGVLLIAQGLRPKGTPSLPRRSVFCVRGRRRPR